MPKKATSKPAKVETPKEDILEEVIPTKPASTQSSSDPFDDDPFSSGVSVAVTPVRVEPDELLEEDAETGDSEPDDFGRVFLGKDKEISEAFLKKVEDIDNVDQSGVSKVIGELEVKVAELTAKLGAAQQEIEYLKENPQSLIKPANISDQFDQLYKSLGECRAAEILASVQKDYLDLKYNSYSDEDKKKIEEVLKDALKQRFEGKVRAASLIHKLETKGK